MPMYKKLVGKTNLEIGVLGLGCAPLGGNFVDLDYDDAAKIIKKALAMGISYFDTAPWYGFGRSERVGYIILALLISIASLRYIERPFRERRFAPSRKKVFLFTGLVSLLIMMAGLSLWKTRGVPARLPAEVAVFDATKGDAFFQKSRSFIDKEKSIALLGAKNKPCKLMVWGDSHAGVLLSMIDEICHENNISALAATKGQHPPVLAWSGADPASFQHAIKTQYADKVMSHIRRLVQSSELEHVLLVFRWNYYLENVPRAADDAVPVAGFQGALIKTVKTLEQLGLEVSVLLEVPDFGVHVPKAVALHHWRGLPEPRLNQQQHNERQQFYMPLIKRLQAETPNVRLIDASPYFISKERQVSFIDEQAKLLYRDDHHLTEHASMRLKPLFKKLFLN